ncbi:MAG TPA: hypothetical protein G4N95_04705 [Anaerolineae bacterium]|nr:hypothetical protein [Anaerolineae bacterium]
MLKQLLTILQDETIYQVEDIANKLGTSTAMVVAMLGMLTRQGYLGEVEQACTSACKGCALAKQCKVASRTDAHIWVMNAR